MLAAVIGGAALLAAVMAWWPWMRRKIHHRLFTDQVLKLLAADNLERARKLCKVAPDSPFALAVDDALAAAAASAGQPEAERLAQVRGAFGDRLRAELAKRSTTTWFGLFAVAGAVLAGYLVLVEGAPTAALIAPGVGLVLLLHTWRIAVATARDGVVHGDRLYAPIISASRSPRA